MASKRTGGDFCSAINCTNRRCKEECRGMAFFTLPHRDETRCRKWIQNMRREDLMGKTMAECKKNGYRLCSKHFEPNQFNVPSERKRLVFDAVPTLFDVPNPPPTVTLKRKVKERFTAPPPPKRPNTEDTIPLPDSNSADQHLKKTEPSAAVVGKLRHGLKTTRNRLYRTKKSLKKAQAVKNKNLMTENLFLKSLSKFLPHQTANFVRTQVKMFKRSKMGRRWTDKDKSLALSLYHASKKCYCLLQKIFILPSVSTLRKTVKDVQIYPGFNSKLFSCLSQKVKSLSTNSDLCSLAFDEMSIKEKVCYDAGRDEVEGLEDFGFCGKSKYVANHVTVFLARGLVADWKQPLGYFLSSGPIKSSILSTLLLKCISLLSDAGLNVKCVVADQGSNNVKTFSSLGVSEIQPFFLVGNKKILVFYDAPHLLKNVRNNFRKSGFFSDKGKVDWKYVVDFYNLDRQNSVRLAPKLTDKHINLPPFSALRVSYAAQVLSHSVAAGIFLLGSLQQDAGSIATSDFIEKFDCLFNAFNSSGRPTTQKMGHTLSSSSGHVEFFEEMLPWLENLKTCSSRNLLCISGWKMSIRSLILLWRDLNSNHNVSSLCTRRLNQDCVENLFSRIRGSASCVTNPSPSEFRALFRNIMVDCLFLHSQGSNCKDDGDKFLLSFKNLMQSNDGHNNNNQFESACVTDDNNNNINASDECQSLEIASDFSSSNNNLLVLMKSNVVTYISGYIAFKLKSKVCTSCQDFLTGTFQDSQDEQLIKLKQYSACCLTTPSQNFKSIISKMEIEFMKITPPILHTSKLKTKLLSKLKAVCPLFTNSCNCDISEKILRLFFNVRLNHLLKECNRSFKSKVKRRNRKVMIVSHE